MPEIQGVELLATVIIKFLHSRLSLSGRYQTRALRCQRSIVM